MTYWTIRRREFRADIPDYLATLGPDYPKTVADLVARSMTLTAPARQGFVPNPTRWSLLKQEEESGTLDDYEYRAVRDHGLVLVRSVVEGLQTVKPSASGEIEWFDTAKGSPAGFGLRVFPSGTSGSESDLVAMRSSDPSVRFQDPLDIRFRLRLKATFLSD